MQWFILIVAGLLEVAWAICLKLSQGFTKPAASIATVIFMAASVYLLSLAIKQIPLGTAYAVWTGIGAAGVAILGILLFNEGANLIRILCICLIIAGIVGLKFTGSSI